MTEKSKLPISPSIAFLKSKGVFLTEKLKPLLVIEGFDLAIVVVVVVVSGTVVVVVVVDEVVVVSITEL